MINGLSTDAPMGDLTQRFGRQVRKVRLTLGISQEELASRAGINTSHLGQIERGQKSTTILTACLIADALNSPLEALFR